MPDVLWALLVPLSALYLALGIWGFDYARRRSSLLISLEYLLIEFALGMRINALWKLHKWWPVAQAMPRMLKELQQ